MIQDDRIPTRDELNAIMDKVFAAASDKGDTWVDVAAYWQGSTRWFRNRIGMSSNRTDYTVSISRRIAGAWGGIGMNQIDEESIRSAVKFAEWKATVERNDQKPHDAILETPEFEDPPAMIWSDTTANYDFIDSGKIVQLTCQRAQELGLMVAGNIQCTAVAAAYAHWNPTTRQEDRRFVRVTRGVCSVTARNPKGLGSGWSGITEIDFAKVDEEAIANKAFDKCVASLNPVRIEPGRYTTILEPQAVGDLVGRLLFANMNLMDRAKAEHVPKNGPAHPLFLNFDPSSGLGRSKLGLKIFDERISVWHDPMDPELGAVGFNPYDIGLKKISYIEHGVLTSLAYNKKYAANRLEMSDQNVHRMSFRMSGGETSLDEMIATTKRGILVTRFSGGAIADASSLIATGLTRDGLWLIENGKIKSSIRNFRTLESPFFVLNNIEQLGPPQKVYTDFSEVAMAPHLVALNNTKNFAAQYIVPPLKVHDFSFSATIDAV